MSNVPVRHLRPREVAELVGLSERTLTRLERAGLFPRRRTISPRAVAWLSSEIDDWLMARR